jgi:hypothetical protein
MNRKNRLRMRLLTICALSALAVVVGPSVAQQAWTPNTDWGHWRLGHKPDLEFLRKNHLTLTFGPGAPNFEEVDGQKFNQEMENAKALNLSYHNQGYIVLRYLSSSLNGDSETPDSAPRKDQIRMLQFYKERWDEFKDYIGPRPGDDPTTWMMVRPDGSFPFYRYAPYGKTTGKGFEAWGCPNNPDYVRMMEGKIRAQAEAGIDGSYIDWTQIAGGTCYCKYCRQNFIAFLQKHLPPAAATAKYGTADYSGVRPPEKRGDAFWMEWIQFRGNSVAEFHRHLREVARAYNPHFMISGNVFGGFGYGPIAYDAAGNVEMLGRDGYDDFVYSEIQEFLDSAPRKNEAGVKITNSPALKFLAAATHGKPVIVYATEITPPIFPNPTEQCLSAMAQINIVEAEANHAIFREKRETPAGAAQVYSFLASNEDKLIGAQLDSNVAVLASLNQYLADELSFAFSTSRVFADRGIAHTMMVEDDLLSRGLGKYDMIVVPYLPLLGREKQQALVRYAEQGGFLLILGQSGKKDEYNVPQTQAPLATLFGTSGYPQGEERRPVGKGQAQFIPVPIPASRYLISMKAKGDYTTFGPTMADLFADIPEGYTRNRIDPALRRVLNNAADRVIAALPDRLTRLVENQPYLELTSMMAGNQQRMLIHLVNYDVTLNGVITPAHGVNVEVAVPQGKKVESVHYSGSLSALKPLKFQSAGSRIRFLADEVGIYGLAVVELQ